jgi:hypothetical protein
MIRVKKERIVMTGQPPLQSEYLLMILKKSLIRVSYHFDKEKSGRHSLSCRPIRNCDLSILGKDNDGGFQYDRQIDYGRIMGGSRGITTQAGSEGFATQGSRGTTMQAGSEGFATQGSMDTTMQAGSEGFMTQGSRGTTEQEGSEGFAIQGSIVTQEGSAGFRTQGSIVGKQDGSLGLVTQISTVIVQAGSLGLITHGFTAPPGVAVAAEFAALLGVAVAAAPILAVEAEVPATSPLAFSISAFSWQGRKLNSAHVLSLG